MEICQQTITNFPHKRLLMKLRITARKWGGTFCKLLKGQGVKSPTGIGRE